jgi:hypothetical protein
MTLHLQSGDTSEDSHVLAPTDDQLPMVVVTHLPFFQIPMIATTYEDSSSIEEPYMQDAHHGCVDPLIQEEVQDVHTVDFTHTDQHEEIESQLLETPLVEQIVDADRFMEHLLPGSACMDEDALFSSQDDHSTCLDTSIWDPGADDSSRLSAQEDTTAHTGYSMIQRELAVEDDVQLRMGRPSGTVDNRQFNTLSSAESVVEDFSDGTSSERHEVVPQHDYDQESHHLAGQLRVSEAMIMTTTRHFVDTHALVVDYCWEASVAHGSADEGFSMDDFHTLRERVSMMRTDYQQLLTDRDYLLRIGEMYHEALREQELEVDRLTQELESTRGFLRGTQTTLQESESRSDELLEEIRQRSTSSVLVDTQICPSVTWLEDGGGLAEEHQLMEDTSICVQRAVDLHIEVDPAVRPGSVMQHESTGDDMSMPEHTVMSDSSQRHAEMYGGIQRGVLPCREETHLGEHADTTPLQQHMDMREHLHHISSCMRDERWRLVDQQLEELLLVVPDDWGLVMATDEQLSGVQVDVLLVESLGLTEAGSIFQFYGQLQMPLLPFPDTFIMDNNMRRDRQWQRAWRVRGPRPPDRSTFTASSRIEMDRHRQPAETWCVMVSTIGQMIADEHGGLPTVISLTQEQLEEVGSDKLPSLPWDPGVHLVSRVFHYMVTQVAPESHTLHQGSVWSGSAGICLIERGNFSLLIIMIGRGDGWTGTSSTEMSLQIQFMDNRSNGHRYFSMRIQERRIQYVCRGQTVIVRVVQGQHGDLRQRLAWDPGIAGLSISLTDRGEWTIAGESYSNFPLSFSVERSASLAGVSRRSGNTSFGHQHEQLMEAVWILVETWRMDSFRDEAMCLMQETLGVDVFQGYASQGLAVHDLIWDPGSRVHEYSSSDGFYCVSHRWTWDPGILFEGIWLLLEDKQFSSREDCNVPTLGHHHSAEVYDDQSSQMDVIASTGVIERHCGVQLALLILFHHYEPFRTDWLWFRGIPTISMVLSIFGYKSIKFTEEVILGTLLGGTSQCNSSLESGEATLQDGMLRSDFQWPGKPQGEIRRFSEVKRLIN